MYRDTIYVNATWKSKFCEGGRRVMERPGITAQGVNISPALSHHLNRKFPRSPMPSHLPLAYVDPEVKRDEFRTTFQDRFPQGPVPDKPRSRGRYDFRRNTFYNTGMTTGKMPKFSELHCRLNNDRHKQVGDFKIIPENFVNETKLDFKTKKHSVFNSTF